MEIKLTKDEKVNLLYSECPMCHKPYNLKKRKKTSHHAIPLILKPLTEVKMNICLECHDKLNKLTGQFEIDAIQYSKNASNYEDFMHNYHKLKAKYIAKAINRGQFGEGLWSNLVSYLGDLDTQIKSKTSK